METLERRAEIIEYLRQNRLVSTRELSTQFDVSEVTIRNDLKLLSKQGWVDRIHGGAQLGERLQQEQRFTVRETLNRQAKRRIARAAVAEISPGDTIILDSSTTVLQLHTYIAAITPLRVVTNSVEVSRLLAPKTGIDVVMTAGLVRGETWSLVGPQALETLDGMHADIGFFGAAGLHAERGLTDADDREVQVKRAMVKAVGRVIVLVDASKHGQQAYRTYATLPQIHHLYTDADLPQALATACAVHDIGVTDVSN